jgi:hypothetical protein
MTVGELKEALQSLDDDAEVHLAMQPSWPMEYAVDYVLPTDDAVYLVELEQIGYLPGDVAAQLGW